MRELHNYDPRRGRNRDKPCHGVGKRMVWSGWISAGIVAKTHSFLFEADMQIRGASYQELLNRLACPPESLPGGTETAVVYYLPGEPSRGYGESSLVLNRSAQVESGLQVNATLVYEAESVKPAAAVSAARTGSANCSGIWDSNGVRIDMHNIVPYHRLALAPTDRHDRRRRRRAKKGVGPDLVTLGRLVGIPARNFAKCSGPCWANQLA